MPLQDLHSGNSKGSRNASCPQNCLFCGNFPAVLKSGEGGGAAPRAPQRLSGGGRQIGRHRSRPFMGPKSNGCVRAWLHPGLGTRGMARGFTWREEVQVGLAGGQSVALTPRPPAVSSCPGMAAPVAPGRGKRSPYLGPPAIAKVSAFILSTLCLNRCQTGMKCPS